MRVKRWRFMGWGGPLNLVPRWRKVTVAIQYFDEWGREVTPPWNAK